MSTPLAIAAVTRVLTNMLNEGIVRNNLSSIVGNIEVSALPPDRISVTGQQDPTQLNLFLYRVTPNPGWRNIGLPSHHSNGERVNNQPMPLDLHYLLTAYGSQAFFPEILLGHAMMVFHETPVVARESIRRALAPQPPDPTVPAELANSDLANQVEMIKIILEPQNTEEVSKLWSSLQARFRLTVAYQVSVVLIEGAQSTQAALPISANRVFSDTLNLPWVESVSNSTGANDPILPTSTLVIRGRRLKNNPVRVLVGDNEYTPNPQNVTDTQITFPLSPSPGELFAGSQGLQVVHEVDLQTPNEPHRGYYSNLEPFLLRPSITPGPVASSTVTLVDGTNHVDGRLPVTFGLEVRRDHRVLLMLNEFDPPSNRPARAYSFPAPRNNGITDPQVETTNAIDFVFRNVIQGAYLVRVQVNGAENPLSTNANGIYSNPQVDIQ